MRLLGIAVALVLSGISTPAWSTDWQYVATTTTNAKWYVDLDSYRRTGNAVNYWVKIDFSEDSTVPYREEKRNFRAKCAERQTKILSFVEYNADGSVRNSQNLPDYGDTNMNNVVPDTIGESVLKFVCP